MYILWIQIMEHHGPLYPAPSNEYMYENMTKLRDVNVYMICKFIRVLIMTQPTKLYKITLLLTIQYKIWLQRKVRILNNISDEIVKHLDHFAFKIVTYLCYKFSR